MRPLVWIGAPSPGALALPAAHPSASTLYAPRGVYVDERVLIVADSGNHRILIWHGVPTHDGAPADVVLGQPDFTTEGPRAAGRGPERGLHLPTAVAVHDGNLIVADSWHHRLLIWCGIPTRPDEAPAAVLGQPDFTAVEVNRGGPVGPGTLYWPYGFGFHAGELYITDTGNRRVLRWSDGLALGQPDNRSSDENRGGPASAASFRWPHAAAALADALLIADAGNHRILGWHGPLAEDRPADTVLGQEDFLSAGEFPYAPQTPARLRFPYSLAVSGSRLAAADTANNRVLLWNRPPHSGAPADAVLGQDNFTANGENRWKAVTHDSLCWPYGLSWHANRLAIADSGNNRVILWET